MSTLNIYCHQQLKKAVDITSRWHTDQRNLEAYRWITATVHFLARAVFYAWRNSRYLTFVKIANIALVNIEFKLKREHLFAMPYRMKIEPTNICNTHCQLCPTGLGFKGRDKGSMKLESYKTLVDQFSRTLFTLDLSMWGDPLIVPDIYKMIRYAHDKRIWTYLSSNLHAFKPDKGQADALVKSGLDMLTCSLHGATQQTYEQYQPGKQLETSLEKIRAIVEAKKRLRSLTPEIQLNFVVTRFNEHEMQAFKDLANSLGCKPVFSSPSLNLRFIGKDKNLVDLGIADDVRANMTGEQLDRWLPENDRFVIQPYKAIKRGIHRDEQYNGQKSMDCQWPWKDAVINWDGSVVTCCGVFDQKEDMGNVMQTPFKQIWNNKSYRMARRSFKVPVDQQDDHINPCRECPGILL